MLEVRRLRLLHALAHHGTVTAAAESLHLTGPAVTQQLAVLEKEVGVRLTERDGRRLRLTEAGQVLLGHTEILLDQLASAEADLVALRTEVRGTVRIGAFTSSIVALVPQALAAVRARHQDRLALHLTEVDVQESQAMLCRGELDIALVHSYDMEPWEPPPACERHPLFSGPLGVVVPADDPLASTVQPTDPLDLALLASHPWITDTPRTECHETLRRLCAQAGFVPRVTAHCNDITATLALVAAGLGVAALPWNPICANWPGVALRRMAQVEQRHVFAVTRRSGNRHPAVQVVLEALQEAAPTAQYLR